METIFDVLNWGLHHASVCNPVLISKKKHLGNNTALYIYVAIFAAETGVLHIRPMNGIFSPVLIA